MTSLEIYAKVLQDKINKTKNAFEAMKEFGLSTDAFFDLYDRVNLYETVTKIASSDFSRLTDEIIKETEKSSRS